MGYFSLQPVFLNAVWSAIYIMIDMKNWLFWFISIGLIIEYAFLRIFIKDSHLKSLIMSVVMNAISALFGIILIPYSGLLVEIFMVPADKIFHLHTFHISHIVLSYLIAVLCNAIIETLTLKIIFKKPFKKIFWWVCVANALSVIICVPPLFIFEATELWRI